VASGVVQSEQSSPPVRLSPLAIHLSILCRVADAEALPFADGIFDVVLFTFGVMFNSDQERAAGELMRVCRAGGRIGLANWTSPKAA
jgi:ubiquinone/menaquinone biosynthesis C-methylase UbiE